MKIKILDEPPISIAGGALYPYSEELLANMARTTNFDESFSLARVVGAGAAQRILIPRQMAPMGGLDNRRDGYDFNFKSKFKPRDKEQSRIINETMALLDDGHNFLISAPTGCGKTWMAMDILARVGKKTLVVVTKDDIKDQWAEAAKQLLGLEWGKGIGIIQADKVAVVGQGIVIAFVQSIAREDRYPASIFVDFGLVIWDECHRIGADFFSQSAYRVPAKLRLGFSATTERSDGKSEVLEAHIGPVMVTSELAPMKAKVIYKRSSWKVPMVHRKVKTSSGTYAMKVIPLPHSPGKCMHIVKLLAVDHPRNRMICNFIAAAYKKGRHILVQADTVEHIETFLAMIPTFGIPTSDIGWYKAGQSKVDRDKIKLKRVIVATYKMTSEATDIPRLDTLVMATPKADVRQIVGRILRTHPDKAEPVVFDIIDASSPVFNGYWNTRKKWYSGLEFEMSTPVDKQN